jgi:UDP:flavonoid glycosyltransferase YjiC (YdhE family)
LPPNVRYVGTPLDGAGALAWDSPWSADDPRPLAVASLSTFVLPQAAALVTQCGLGTVMKALMHGVPLICLPLIGDQPDNAARVVARGAGVQLGRDASPAQIRAAVWQVLSEPCFRAGTRRFAAVLREDDGAERAARELETVGIA